MLLGVADFEPSAASCNGTEFPPACGPGDDALFAKLLTAVRAAINVGGRSGAAPITVSVDTGEVEPLFSLFIALCAIKACV